MCNKVIYTVKFQYETGGRYPEVGVGTGFSDVFFISKEVLPCFCKVGPIRHDRFGEGHL
jgi:hypothetical protein